MEYFKVVLAMFSCSYIFNDFLYWRYMIRVARINDKFLKKMHESIFGGPVLVTFYLGTTCT